MKNNLSILVWIIVLYYVLKYLVPLGDYVIYPFTLVVTVLHEFWHAFFALITWWAVKWIHIETNGSWYAITAWWIRSLVLMWGYIGSAIFWNILLYIWFKKPKIADTITYILALLFLFIAIFWFHDILTSLILFVFAISLYFIAKKTDYDSLLLQLIWVFSILYIIEDFNVGPSSDLSKFSTFLPTSVWMIIWLLIVLAITGYNLKLIFKNEK